MSGRIKFAGSWYGTMGQAAAAWAATALPDTSVIERSEDASDAADTLEVYWWNEARRIGEGSPDDVDADEWRDACRKALVERIETSRQP